MCQDCQHSNLCYDCIFAKPFKKCPICEIDVQGWSCCVQIDTKGEVTSPFKNSKQQVHIVKDLKKVAFKGLNLNVAFDNNIVQSLILITKRNWLLSKLRNHLGQAWKSLAQKRVISISNLKKHI